LLECIRQVIGVDTITILLQIEGGQQLAVRATLGLEEEIAEGIRIPIGRGFAGHIAASREPMIVDDLSKVEVVSPILQNKGIQSMVGVPLLVENQVIGVFHVGTFVPTHLPRTMHGYCNVADSFGLAIACPTNSPGTVHSYCNSSLITLGWWTLVGLGILSC